MEWVVVQVVIGLSFLFFLLSVVASAMNEAIAGIFKLRAKTLERGITNLLTGATSTTGSGLQMIADFYSHPLISAYGKNAERPSYISPRSFRMVLLDIAGLSGAVVGVTPDGAPLPDPQVRMDVDAALGAVQDQELKDALTTIWRSVQHDVDGFREGIELWFDRSMERVSGWYKRRVQVFVFVIGLALAVLLNASAITAADRLWKDEGFRRGLLAQVEGQRSDASAGEALAQLETLRFPIGWEAPNRPDGAGGWAFAAVGWLLTGIAITFGAPFWFDVLNKVSNLRAAGRKPESAPPP